VALPVSGEIDTRLIRHGQTRNAGHLLAVGDAAHILAESRLLSVADQVRPADVVVMPNLAAAQPGKVFFGPITYKGK
jgi:hypothetical protein